MTMMKTARAHRPQPVYNVVGSTRMARSEGRKSEAREVERVRLLWEAMFHSPPARRLGERCKLPLATWRFRTFYRLTKPLLLSILLILNLFKQNERVLAGSASVFFVPMFRNTWDRMPFLLPNQQCRYTEGNKHPKTAI